MSDTKISADDIRRPPPSAGREMVRLGAALADLASNDPIVKITRRGDWVVEITWGERPIGPTEAVGMADTLAGALEDALNEIKAPTAGSFLAKGGTRLEVARAKAVDAVYYERDHGGNMHTAGEKAADAAIAVFLGEEA